MLLLKLNKPVLQSGFFRRRCVCTFHFIRFLLFWKRNSIEGFDTAYFGEDKFEGTLDDDEVKSTKLWQLALSLLPEILSAFLNSFDLLIPRLKLSCPRDACLLRPAMALEVAALIKCLLLLVKVVLLSL